MEKASSQDWAGLTGSLTDCLDSVKEGLTKELAGYLAGRTSTCPRSKLPARAPDLFHALKLVTAVGIGYQVVTYLNDISVEDVASRVSLFPKVIKPPVQPTAKEYYTPLDESGALKPGLHRTDPVDGGNAYCSIGTGNYAKPGFFWCSPSDGERDPCWEVPNVGIVVTCPASPWATELYARPVLTAPTIPTIDFAPSRP